MIELQNISFHYAKRKDVINNLSLQIPKGSLFGLLGHNGAGKTTIFRLIIGLLKPCSGEIHLDCFRNKSDRRLISYMPEFNGIYENLTGLQNLQFRARAAKIENANFKIHSEKLLKELKLYERANEKCGYWSNGMKKRLALACALIVNPKLLILDEPTNGIDPESLNIVRNMLKKINKEGTTIVFSSHDLNTVEKLCTNIAVLEEGSLIYKGNLNSIKDSLEEFYLSLTTNKCEVE